MTITLLRNMKIEYHREHLKEKNGFISGVTLRGEK